MQAYFLLERLGEQAAGDPAVAADPVVQALLAGDLRGAAAHGLEALGGRPAADARRLDGRRVHGRGARVVRPRARPGDRAAVRGAAVRAHAGAARPAARAAASCVFVVTGGGVEFVRAASEDAVRRAAARTSSARPCSCPSSAATAAWCSCGRRPRSAPSTRARRRRCAIQQHIGRRPILAAGNSAGDTEMLEYAETGDRPALCLVVQHDDADREHAYAGTRDDEPEGRADRADRRRAAAGRWSACATTGRGSSRTRERRARRPTGMAWVEGATFRMGSDDHYPEEGPAREVAVDALLRSTARRSRTARSRRSSPPPAT